MLTSTLLLSLPLWLIWEGSTQGSEPQQPELQGTIPQGSEGGRGKEAEEGACHGVQNSNQGKMTQEHCQDARRKDSLAGAKKVELLGRPGVESPPPLFLQLESGILEDPLVGGPQEVGFNR